MRTSDKGGSVLGPGAVTLLMLGLIAGVALDRVAGPALSNADPRPALRVIAEAWTLIQRYYVDQSAAEPRAMTYAAISGMVNALGDTGHSRFLTPQMVKALANMERNKFQGIGAEILLKAGHVVIAVPLDGSPAQRAGLKPGDIILKVNGRSVTGLPLDQVVEEISGPVGTSVVLTILAAASGQTRDVTLTRETIELHDVTWQMLPGTHFAHLRISGFNDSSSDDLRTALINIRRANGTGIILDLRNNPGGLLKQAVAAASQFLHQGDVALVKNARGQEKAIPVKPGGEAITTPLICLVNAGTASGAEIVAGALQDDKRAQLVGETTFGTGTVLTEFKLSDGSALLLAIEEWLTPGGHVIWHKGITPGVRVALPAGVMPSFPESELAMTAAQLQHSGDAQLLRALELIQP